MTDSPIFLIGFMACGKTTLGKALAGAFPELVEFVDLDEAIEARAGASVAEIFSSRGEACFRRMEADILREIAASAAGRHKRVVVGCGGGTPCHGSNMDFMLGAGTVVWLNASRERTVGRLLDDGGKRPLMAGLDGDAVGARVDSLLAARAPAYSRAHCRFDSSRLDDTDEVAATADLFARRFLFGPTPD